MSGGARRVLVATRNAGKLRELRAHLVALGLDVLDLDAAGVPHTLDDEDVEVHETFEANALAKACHYRDAAGGLPTIADDSGLEVHALGGAPGVRSRRWSGIDGEAAAVDAANNAKLLAELRGHHDRGARFVCAIAYVDGDDELVVRGTTDGAIVEVPAGAGGFGYDPLFRSHELGLTFGEASPEQKASVGHRGRAVAALAERLRARADRRT